MQDPDVESAYFALLRAREAVTDLQRWQEYLRDEARRLRRSTAEADALSTQAPPRLRRRLLHTDGALAEAVRLRLEVIDDELRRLPDRVAAAEEDVAEREREHDRLRSR
jgi:hypothetical protein